MSIAEKLLTIAENEQAVFNGINTEADLISEIQNMVDNLPNADSGAYNEGYETGQKVEYDRFWDAYQDYGKRMDYQNAFSGKGWTKETFRPKYNISPLNGYMMFRYNSAEVDLVEYFNELGIEFDDSKNENVAYMYFASSFTRIGTVTLTRKSTGDMFAYCNNLKTIDKIISFEGTIYTNANFTSCSQLANITFDGAIATNINFADSSLLTNNSVQSIIDHLKDLTGLTSQTLTFHADVGARLTDEQKTTITAKNWTLAY